MMKTSLITIWTALAATSVMADPVAVSPSQQNWEQKAEAKFHALKDQPVKAEHKDRRLAYEHKRMMFDEVSPETAGVMGPAHPAHHMDNLSAIEHRRLMFGQND